MMSYFKLNMRWSFLYSRLKGFSGINKVKFLLIFVENVPSVTKIIWTFQIFFVTTTDCIVLHCFRVLIHWQFLYMNSEHNLDYLELFFYNYKRRNQPKTVATNPKLGLVTTPADNLSHKNLMISYFKLNIRWQYFYSGSKHFRGVNKVKILLMFVESPISEQRCKATLSLMSGPELCIPCPRATS